MSKEVETGNEPSRHLPGVGQGVVEEDELVVVRVAVELSPDRVLKPGSNKELKPTDLCPYYIPIL